MDRNPILRFYKAITEIWKRFVLWMTLLKCIDLHDNLADELKWAESRQKHNIPVLLASFCVRCTSFIAPKWCNEIVFWVFLTALHVYHLNFS